MLAFLSDLAKAGGRVARENFASVLGKDVRAKGLKDYVSHVDQLVQDALIRRIRARYPGHQILGEEGAVDGAIEAHLPLWIIDPIDGTTNFIHGLPHFAISIAYCEHLEPRCALIYDPMRDEGFYGESGAGLWLNGERRYSSGCADLSRAVVASALPFRFPEAFDDVARVFLAVQRACDDQRRSGSAALDLAYVAVGRLDAYWELGIHTWDTAAGELLVRCGGGVASDWRGRLDGVVRRRSIVAGATPELHRQLLAKVEPLVPWLDRAPFTRL